MTHAVARAGVLAGACASCLGVLVASTRAPTAGGVVTVIGWLVLAASLHAFGRAGVAE